MTHDEADRLAMHITAKHPDYRVDHVGQYERNATENDWKLTLTQLRPVYRQFRLTEKSPEFSKLNGGSQPENIRQKSLF